MKPTSETRFNIRIKSILEAKYKDMHDKLDGTDREFWLQYTNYEIEFTGTFSEREPPEMELGFHGTDEANFHGFISFYRDNEDAEPCRVVEFDTETKSIIIN